MVCTLLGGFLNYGIQLSLGLVAFCALIFKYIVIEKKERHFDIWLKDVMRQIIGLMIAHLWNMLFAYILANNTMDDNQCEAYFVNYLVDNTLGILFNCSVVYFVNSLVIKRKIITLQTGFYHFGWKSWRLQLLVWLCIITFVKLFLFGTIVYPLKDYLINFGEILLTPVNYNDDLELVIVMVLTPLIFNIFQFVIQDLFLRHKKKSNIINEDLNQKLNQDYCDDYYHMYDDNKIMISSL